MTDITLDNWTEAKEDDLLILASRDLLPQDVVNAIGVQRLRAALSHDGAVGGPRPGLKPTPAEVQAAAPRAYGDMSNEELRTMLALRKLSVAGRKSALLARLHRYDLGELEDEDKTPEFEASEEADPEPSDESGE